MKATKSQIMKSAHSVAKIINTKVGCYSISLGIALRNMWKAAKSGSELANAEKIVIRLALGAIAVQKQIGRVMMQSRNVEDAARYMSENEGSYGKTWESEGRIFFYSYNK